MVSKQEYSRIVTSSNTCGLAVQIFMIFGLQIVAAT